MKAFGIPEKVVGAALGAVAKAGLEKNGFGRTTTEKVVIAIASSTVGAVTTAAFASGAGLVFTAGVAFGFASVAIGRALSRTGPRMKVPPNATAFPPGSSP